MEKTEAVNGSSRKRRILLVDDDLAVRESLAQALNSENFSVIAAGSSREALCEYAQGAVDLAILDLNLGPGDSGWGLFESLEQLATVRSGLPIIVMSARAEALEHSFAHRALARLHKPLDIASVIQSINTCLGARRGQSDTVIIKRSRK